MDQLLNASKIPSQFNLEQDKVGGFSQLLMVLFFIIGLSAVISGAIISKLLPKSPQNYQINVYPKQTEKPQQQFLMYLKSDNTNVSLISVYPLGEKKILNGNFPKDDFATLKSLTEDSPLIYPTSKNLFYIRDPQSQLLNDLLSKAFKGQQLPSDDLVKTIVSGESQKKKELIKVNLISGSSESLGETERSVSESLVPGTNFTLTSQHVVLGEKPGMKRISSRTYFKSDDKSEKTLLVDDLAASSSGYLKFIKVCSSLKEFLAIREESTRNSLVENPEIYQETGLKEKFPILPPHGFSGHYYSSTGMDRLFSPDCKRVAIVKREKDQETVVIRNLADGKETIIFENKVFNPLGIINLAFSGDGEYLLVERGSGYDLISLKSNTSKKFLSPDRIKQEKLVQDLTISNSSHWYYRLSEDANYLVFQWPVSGGEKLILYNFETDKFLVLDEVNIKYSPSENSTFSDTYQSGFAILGWSTLGTK